MTTPHPLADLLIVAAKDKDARFVFDSPSSTPFPIGVVLNNSQHTWKLVEPVDPYAELKAAYAAGKVIEIKQVNDTVWRNCNPLWIDPVSNYRIKPEPVVKYLWATKEGLVSDYLMADDDSKGESWIVCLTWSRTEFQNE